MKPWKKKQKKLLKVSENETPFTEMLMAVPMVKTDWWYGTNDPKTWGPYVSIPKSTAAEMVGHKQALEKELFFGHSGAVSVSASSNGMYWSAQDNLTNYVQIFPMYPEQAFMTYEKAVALNNGD